MRKMRGIDDAYREIAKKDPDSAVTKTGFRRLVNEGKIPHINIGKKRLVSMEDVYHFFNNN